MPATRIRRFLGIVPSPTAETIAPGMACAGHDFISGDPGPDGSIPMAPGYGRTRAIEGSATGLSLSAHVVYALRAADNTHTAELAVLGITSGSLIVAAEFDANRTASIRGINYYTVDGLRRAIKQV